MLLSVLHAQYTLLFTSIEGLYRGILARDPAGLHPQNNSLPATEIEDDDAATVNSHVLGAKVEGQDSIPFPPTERQIDNATHEFVNSINKAVVCDLASRHLNARARACYIVNKKRGGFNICFFLYFKSNKAI